MCERGSSKREGGRETSAGSEAISSRYVSSCRDSSRYQCERGSCDSVFHNLLTVCIQPRIVEDGRKLKITLPFDSHKHWYIVICILMHLN